MTKRILSIFITLALVFTMLPVSAFAEGAVTLDLGELAAECNHVHDSACDYVEAVAAAPCGHLQEDGSYSCAPEDAAEDYVCPHDDDCGYAEATDGIPCTHVHDENCGGIIPSAQTDRHLTPCADQAESDTYLPTLLDQNGESVLLTDEQYAVLQAHLAICPLCETAFVGDNSGIMPLASTTDVQSDLQSAIQNATSGDTLRITADIDLGTTGLTINDSKSLTFNLNGKTISYSGTGSAITVDGVVLTVDDSTGGEIIATAANAKTIEIKNGGYIKVLGGNVFATGNNGTAIYNDSEYSIRIEGGSIGSITSDSSLVTNLNGTIQLQCYTLQIGPDGSTLNDTAISTSILLPKINGQTYHYNTNGIVTDTNGKIYLWLPAGVTGDVKVGVGGYSYKGTITSNTAILLQTPRAATVGDITVTGTVGRALADNIMVDLTFTSNTFQGINNGTDVSSWITNLPDGITAVSKGYTLHYGDGTARIQFTGTPTEESTEQLEITIPSENLTEPTGGNVTVTANANAKFNITAAGTPPSGGGDSSDPDPYIPPVTTPTTSPNGVVGTTTVTKIVKNAQANPAITGALASLAAGNKATKLLFKDFSAVSPEAAKLIAEAAAKAGVSSTIMLDHTENGAILSRIYVDAAKLASIPNLVDLRVDPTPAATKPTTNLFTKYFDNNIRSIALGQQGAFGMTVSIAAKVDLTNMNTKNLYFYSYDKAAGIYTRIEQPAHFIDTAGYLHFNTANGGSIIITDSPLKRK